MSKIENIYLLSRATAEDLARGEWPNFLRTAAWAFKYDFTNQMLIYAQQPNATACATVETWNKAFQRVRNPDAAGIALIEDGGDYMRINYVFDVADTHSPTDKPFSLWSMTEAKEEAVRSALFSTYFPDLNGFDPQGMSTEAFFFLVARTLVNEESIDSVDDLISIRDGIEAFNGLSNTEIAQRFQDLLTNSVAFMMMYRCGIEPETSLRYLSDATLFRSSEAMAILGQTTQALSKQCLNVIAKTIQAWDKTHKEELNHEHESELSTGREQQNPGIDPSGTAEVEPLREAPQGISEGAEAEQVHSPADDGRTDDAPGLSGREDGADGRSGDIEPSDHEPGSGEGSEQLEMDAAHGDDQTAGGGTDLPADDLRITSEPEEQLPDASEAGLDVQLPSTEEELTAVEAAAVGVHLTQDEIDSILTNPSEGAVPYELLASIFRDEPNSETAEQSLIEVYGALVFDHTFPDGTTAEITGNPWGLHVLKNNEVYYLAWRLLAERLRYLVAAERYISEDISAQPMTSADLKVGQVITLHGMKYQMISETDNTVTLQDVEHPIFTQTMYRNILDTLLRNSVPAITSEPLPAKEEERAEEPEAEVEAEPSVTEVSEPVAAPEPPKRVGADLTNYSITTLRYAITSVLRDRYAELSEKLEARVENYMDAEELEVILTDFTGEADMYRGEILTAEQEKVLRTPDFNGRNISVLILRMEKEGIGGNDISFAIRALQALYRVDEAGLREIAESSDVNRASAPAEEKEPEQVDAASVSEVEKQVSDFFDRQYSLAPAKRNYKFLSKYAPEIFNGSLDYIRFESDTFEPLYIERIGKNTIAIAHTYVQNGDLMLDPEIVFEIDEEQQALFPTTYQTSAPPTYQLVYDSEDLLHEHPNRAAEKDINSFARVWFQNLEWQEHTPVRGVKYDNVKGDIEYTINAERELVSEELPLESYIDTVLLRGSRVAEGKERIYGHFLSGASRRDNVEFLKDEYGIGGGTVDLSANVSEAHDSKGIEIYRGGERIRLTWTEAATRIDELIRADLYLTAEEKANYYAERIPEPEIDHPELIRRDLSRDVRVDKVVLTDLLTHFADYRITYALQMPDLSEHDVEAYNNDYVAIDEITVADDIAVNMAHIQDLIIHFNRWFVPFADGLAEHIRAELYSCIEAAENLQKQGIEEIEATDISVAPEEIGEESQVPVIDLQVKAEYIDAILHDETMTRHTWSDVAAYFATHAELSDRVNFLKDHFGDAYTSIYAPDENGKYIGYKVFDDRLEVWEDNYLTTEAKDSLPWYDVCSRIEEAMLIEHYDIDRSESAPVRTEREPSLFDFDFETDDSAADEPAAESPPAPVPVTSAPSIEPTERRNFSITEMNPNYGGPKARFGLNIAAIRLLKELETSDRLATPEEQEILSKYVGWGGLSEAFDPKNERWQAEYTELKELLTEEEYNSAQSSTLTAFYTPPVVIEAIYNGLRQMGFSRGNVLDPCCGTGHFFGMLPEDMRDSKLYGVEIDSISGRIARQLYQNTNILIDGYEKASLPDSIYDVAVGNVPFGDYSLYDRRYDKEHFLIHDYFFAKTLDKVRPGGIVAFITSKGTMDKQNESVRKYIAQRADLLGAIRLPDNVFRDNAGTDAVADILFLRKREQPTLEQPYWVGLDREWRGDDGWGPEINSYFVDNPDMVLGDMVEVSGPHGPVWTCKAREGEDLREALAAAVSKIEGQIGGYSVDIDSLDEQNSAQTLPADPEVRNFSYTVVNGDVYYRENSVMYKADLNKTAEKRVKGMIELRDITRNLIDAQVNNGTDEEILALQRKLGDAYDKYTAKYGIINNRGNSMAFSDDSGYYLLCSLENVDKNGNFLGKADMFYKRTIGRREEITHVDTAVEALGASMGELGRIDLGYMTRISDFSEEDLVNELEGIMFEDPERRGHFELSSMYLSGNVRKKLEAAKAAAEEDPHFEINVSKLEEALPEDLTPEVISVRLGATWIPKDDIEDFMYETFALPKYQRDYNNIKVNYASYTDRWFIDGKTYAYGVKVDSEYGTKRMNALQILENTLNLRDVQVYDTVETSDGKTKRVLNVNETLAAQEKQKLIRDEFQEWIWRDPERRDRLCAEYNRRFNSVVPVSYDGNMVNFHGLNPLIELDAHQKEGIARILYGGNTLLAHTVGAGKTWTMVSAAMEGKHLGLFNKSMVAVPNHLVGQWAAAIYSAYPQANVLASSKKDFEPANRKKFCSRIATGDYDIVVIGHSQFERIPISTERQEALLNEQRRDIIASISELKESKAENFTIKEMERAKKSIETRIERLQNGKNRDNVINFEELGVDRLFIDESHEFKNLFLYSKMNNVAGISQTDSQKASDLFMKCRYMDELTGNMGNIHATGTPVSNTMAEVYTTQRYLQYDALQEMGLGSFDAWASTFGETVVSLELAPEGNGYRPRTRFAKFFNLPELLNMYKQVADVRTKDMLNLPLPQVNYETISLKPSEDQKRIVKGLGERADRIRRGGVDSREDNMLCITNDGRKLALDQRLIDPELPDNPNSKSAACADKIYEHYCKGAEKKLTQLVFCDISTPKSDGSFNVYDDLKQKLIERGIPEDEIRYIHEANSEAQKEALFEKVRTGEVRVLMGSTGKMGTGTNVQNRLIALHHLDCPWRPSDLEQRDGRGERRGNENEQIHIYRYVTEGTFDAYMYQLLEAKQRFISQIFTSRDPAREANDVDDATLSFSEIKALATGNPKIKEKVALEIEISKLEMLKKRHQSEQYRLDTLIRNYLPKKIEEHSKLLPQLQRDMAKATEHPYRNDKGELIPINIKGKEYETFSDAGTAILKTLKKLPPHDKPVVLGTFRDFEIRALVRESAFATSNGKPKIEYHLSIAGERNYEVNVASENGQGIMSRLNNVFAKYLPNRIEEVSTDLATCQKELEEAKANYGKPFARSEELEEMKIKLAALDAELNMEAERESDEIIENDLEAEPVAETIQPVREKLSLNTIIANAEARRQAQAGATQQITHDREDPVHF